MTDEQLQIQEKIAQLKEQRKRLERALNEVYDVDMPWDNAIVNLLTDLHHLAEEHGVDIDGEYGMAKEHYERELAERYA